jgi:hypothetical protein
MFVILCLFASLIVAIFLLQLKGTFKRSKNPFSGQNFAANFLAILCGPFPPRYVDNPLVIIVTGVV